MDSVKSEHKQNKRKSLPQLFKKGQSGNPAGRPKGSVSIIGRIKQIWEEDPESFEDYVKGVLQDSKMRTELVHQIDGKPKERLELSGEIRLGELENLSNDELTRLAE